MANTKVYLTKEILLKTCPKAAQNIKANKNFAGNNIDSIVGLMNRYADEFEINTPLRWAAYLAQVLHESAGLLYSEEIASGKAYEGRKDLGNTQKGDGVKYKGRGLIQLTGRYNYTKYKAYCGYDVVSKPELLALAVGAVRSSMWYWKTNALNYYADRRQFLTITRRINGGTNGQQQRDRLYNLALSAWGVAA